MRSNLDVRIILISSAIKEVFECLFFKCKNIYPSVSSYMINKIYEVLKTSSRYNRGRSKAFLYFVQEIG